MYYDLIIIMYYIVGDALRGVAWRRGHCTPMQFMSRHGRVAPCKPHVYCPNSPADIRDSRAAVATI